MRIDGTTGRAASAALIGRAASAALIAIALAVGLSACGGGSGDSTAAATPSRPNKNGIIIYRPKYKGELVTVGALRSPEQQIFGEIYAQALETAGFEVHRRFDLPSFEVAHAELRSGRITGFMQYPPEALTSFFGYREGQVPTGAAVAFIRAQDELLKEGLYLNGPTGSPAFSRATALATDRSTAQRYGLKTVSDLQGRAARLTLYGPPDCERRSRCLQALETAYGLKFKSFHPVDEDRRYTVLEEGRADLSIVSTIDPQLASDSDFVVLADDEHAFPAAKPAMVTRAGAVSKWFPDFGKWTYEVERGLTPDRMRKLKAEVELEGVSPKAAAATYLKSAGYVE